MHLPYMGNAIIINNVATKMPGSQADVKALQAVYKEMGFDVYCYRDCTVQVTRETVMNDVIQSNDPLFTINKMIVSVQILSCHCTAFHCLVV